MNKKNNEYKEMPVKDLQERLSGAQKELAQLSINHTVTPLDDACSIRHKRREVARILTELRARELKINE